MEYLRTQWLHFVKVLFSPWTILSLAILGWLAYTSVSPILISIWTSIVGGIITKLWMDVSEERLLVARGKMAIRNLKVLFNTIDSTQQRLYEFSSSCTSDFKQQPQFFGEIDHILTILKEETMNSVEVWTDIIPDSDIRTKIGEITSQRRQLKALSDELINVRKERDDAKGKSTELETQNLEREQELLKQIETLRATLLEKAKEIQNSTLSGISGTSGYSRSFLWGSELVEPIQVGPILFNAKIVGNKCKGCGSEIPISLGNRDYCPSCEVEQHKNT